MAIPLPLVVTPTEVPLPFRVPHDAEIVTLTGIEPAGDAPMLAVTDNEVFPPELKFVLAAENGVSVMIAPEYEKSLDALRAAFETVALTDKVAAPEEDPTDEVTPTFATPFESVRDVSELSVARLEFKLKFTSLFAIPTPVPSLTVARAK